MSKHPNDQDCEADEKIKTQIYPKIEHILNEVKTCEKKNVAHQCRSRYCGDDNNADLLMLR